MDSGITTTKGLEVGHRTMEEVSLGGMHTGVAAPISGSVMGVVSLK